MREFRNLCLGTVLAAATPALGVQIAHAMAAPTAIQIDGGPLGPLQISGGVDGYGYFIAPAASGVKADGAYIGETLVELQKATGTLQYTIEIGSYNGEATLGTPFYNTSITNLTTGPLYQAYVTIAPPGSPVTISAGQVGGLDGYEGAFAWGNPSQFVTALYYVENGNSRGVSATYTQAPFTATVTFSDGWDTGVFNWLQAQATYTINPTNAVTLFYGGNLGTVGRNAFLLGGAQVAAYTAGPNSQMLGGWYNYTSGNLNLIPEVQGQYARANFKAGIIKPTWNLGVALLANYQFGTSPYSMGGWLEYFTSHSSAADNFGWFVGPDSQAVGIAASPTWQYKDLYARANLGDLYLLHNTDALGNKFGYGSSGTGHNVVQGTLEAGLEF